MLLFDAHLDLSMNAIQWNRDISRPLAEVRRREADETDKLDRGRGVVTFPEMRKAGIGICVATQIGHSAAQDSVLKAWKSPEIAWAITQAQLAWYRAMEERGELRQIVDLQGLRDHVELWKDGPRDDNAPIGYILSLEGADSMVTLGHLERAYAYGLRALGPAHYGIGRYAPGTSATGPLTPAGRDLVKEMARLGIILDATHLTDEGFFEALDLYDGPAVWASHNNVRALVPHQRQFSVVAAIVAKNLMMRDKIPGSIMLFPGIAEEQMAGKAFLVRAGVFKNTDVTLFTHVGNDLGVSWGASGSSALISAEFRFVGSSAHAAGAPWRGQSALDAVMLMAQGWEYRREHLRLQQRSHYVIKDGGDQPNVVPSTASIWFYFREQDYPRTMALFDMGKKVAAGAAMMTDTKLDTVMILGSGWSGHFSKPVAETMQENIKTVGMPVWDEKDQTLAKGIQKELNSPDFGLSTQIGPLRGAEVPLNWTGGGSDDIGDVSWNVPTITLRFPSNIPGLPGHNWANAISMATPIAHKGALAGAKVQALTVLDLMLTPKVVADAWSYFKDVQTKDVKYQPFIRPQDMPPIWLNTDIMAKYREQQKKFYYDPSKFKTYLEQLGITYPTVRPAPTPIKGDGGAKH